MKTVWILYTDKTEDRMTVESYYWDNRDLVLIAPKEYPHFRAVLLKAESFKTFEEIPAL